MVLGACGARPRWEMLVAAGTPPAQVYRRSASGVALVQLPSMGTSCPKWWGVIVITTYTTITQLQRFSVFNKGKRGEISGPVRVLPISFSLKLSAVFFYL